MLNLSKSIILILLFFLISKIGFNQQNEKTLFINHFNIDVYNSPLSIPIGVNPMYYEDLMLISANYSFNDNFGLGICAGQKIEIKHDNFYNLSYYYGLEFNSITVKKNIFIDELFVQGGILSYKTSMGYFYNLGVKLYMSNTTYVLTGIKQEFIHNSNQFAFHMGFGLKLFK